MMRCVKKMLTSCHGPTAMVMGDFLQDMASPNCSARMATWSALEGEGGGCQGQACGGASTLSVASLTLLLPAWLALRFLADVTSE